MVLHTGWKLMRVLKGLYLWLVDFFIRADLNLHFPVHFVSIIVINYNNVITFCFQISSTDGLSCSGQTPDIAWESFQKRSCSRVKFFRGKRFSCKIDGMEVFRFCLFCPVFTFEFSYIII